MLLCFVTFYAAATCDNNCCIRGPDYDYLTPNLAKGKISHKKK